MQNVVARISLQRIIENAALVIDRAHVPFIAVVKDDAYGHGAEQVAAAIEYLVFAFAVATVDEGVKLRISGISKQILVLTPPLDCNDAARMKAFRLTASISSESSFSLVEAYRLEAHFAINTGMNRYGFSAEQIGDVVRRASDRGFNVTGVYSHFYMADDVAICEEQFALFCKAVENIQRFYPNVLRHMAATGGLLANDRYRLDAVRSGIALYGYLPKAFQNALPVKPAARFYATVTNCCRRIGNGAGYDFACAERNFYTMRVGYGDGFCRKTAVFSRNPLCMDACVCEGIAKIGEERLLFDNVSEYAEMLGTTEYEVLVHTLKGAVKIYDYA